MQTNGSELLLRNARFFIKNVERVSQKSCRATHMNGICFNMGLVEVAENTVRLLEFMAEEIVGEGFEGVLWIGGVFVVKCVPIDGCLWDHG